MGGRAAAPDALVGSELAGYRINALLGRGATSTVYRAFETSLEREVALKILSAELSEDRRFRRRFERESKVAASLDHPNIVPVYAAGEVDGRLYIAMRLIEGSDLKTLLHEEGSLGARRALAICAQVASALDTAHVNGLVHRDVKPSNVLLGESREGDEHAYLADFGVTKTASPGSRATETGQLLGTIDYMSPEQIRGEELDGRADLYSLACVLYESLVGAPPLTRGSDVATIYAHLNESPPAASARKPVLPSDVDAVLSRALAKEPDHRYRTCGELVHHARVALGLPPEAIERPWRRRRRRRLVLLAGAAAVVAAAAAATLALAGGSHETAAPIHQRVALPGYRVTAAARVTDGAPGGRPIVGLIAATDNGKDPVATKLSAKPTGELVFRFDPEHLEPGVGDTALVDPPGTLIGYYVNWITAGGSFVQFPIVTSSTSTDSATRGHVTHAMVRWPRDYWPITGRTAPLTIRQTDSELTVTFNLQKIVRRYRAVQKSELNYLYSAVYLLDTFVNPLDRTTLRASVEARPCLDPECTKLGARASDRISFELPRDLTVRAANRALYGKRASFTGTGAPGDIITLARTEKPLARAGGPGRVCTVSMRRWCSPRVGPAWIGESEFRTTVGSDGTWSLSVPMKPSFVENWLGLTGRWAAVASADMSLLDSPLFIGSSNVFADAPADTVVALAKPRLKVERRDGRLVVRIAVDGGDNLVRYVLRRDGEDLAAGPLLGDGTVVAEIPVPPGTGPLVVTVSKRGVESATASIEIGTARPAHQRVALPGYRLTVSERLTSGAAGAHPNVGLLAVIDDGKGGVGTRASAKQAGVLEFRFDARQFAAEGGNLTSIPAGTRIGYFFVDSTVSQMPITKTGFATDTATGDQIVRARIAVLPTFVQVVGRSLPMTIRRTRTELIAAVDLRSTIRKFQAVGAAFHYRYAALFLLGRIKGFGGADWGNVSNPTEPSVFRGSIRARLCADRACTRLGRQARDTITVGLPKVMSVRAPIRATYGRPTAFTGTGIPGERIAVARMLRPGEAVDCARTADHPPCAPGVALAFEGDDKLVATVGPDGTWSLNMPLPPPGDRAATWLGQSGRYGVVSSTESSLGPLLMGGSETVLAQAGADTIVALAQPAIRLHRDGQSLAIRISVPGGDATVRFGLRVRGREVESGRLGPSGSAQRTIALPQTDARIEVRVSRPGVEPATSSAFFQA